MLANTCITSISSCKLVGKIHNDNKKLGSVLVGSSGCLLIRLITGISCK